MRDILIFLLVVAVGVLGYITHSQTTSLRDQEKRVLALAAKLDATAKTSSLDLQEKCWKQSQEIFRLGDWHKNQLASFENHYNERVNRCFLIVSDTDTKTAPGTIFVNKILGDAFEERTLGSYTWRSDKVKKYWENPPLECNVILPSGEKKSCNSLDQWEELVKAYMQ
jgi:hypothetical protein